MAIADRKEAIDGRCVFLLLLDVKLITCGGIAGCWLALPVYG